MSQNGLIQRFPNRRMVAADGMAVTAEVWNHAHEYHRQLFAAHAKAINGSGVVTGLEVIADTPPGSHVHVAPGVAIDHHGQTIVVVEPQAYNLRNQDGTVYLILTYSEGAPRSEATAEGPGAPQFSQIGYTLEAKTALPAEPYVEIARIRRPNAATPVTNARNPEVPNTYEIDLRYRGQVALSLAQPMLIAVNGLDDQVTSEHLAGWQNLAREVRQTTGRPLWIDQNVSLETTLEAYPLVCLTGQKPIELARSALAQIHEYVKQGGILYFEGCRRTLRRGNPDADSTVERLVSGMGGRFVDLPLDHPLLRKPYFFPQLPEGYEPRSGSTLRIAQGIGKGIVLHSTFDYGCLWAGDRKGQRLMRDEIRAAFEWGTNLITFAIEQQQKR